MKSIKIIFAIALFVCLLDMPYGYYQLIRFVGLVLFGYLAYENFQKGDTTKAFIFLSLAVLFQPLLKIALGRVLWNIIDVIIGIGLVVDVLIANKNTK